MCACVRVCVLQPGGVCGPVYIVALCALCRARSWSVSWVVVLELLCFGDGCRHFGVVVVILGWLSSFWGGCFRVGLKFRVVVVELPSF